MWLEERRYMSVGIEGSDALGTLQNLLGMVGIVAQEHQLRAFYLEVEPTVNTAIAAHSLTQLIGGTSAQLRHRHGCHTILYVDRHWLTELHTRDILYR